MLPECCLCIMATGFLCNSMLPVVSFRTVFVCLQIFMRIEKNCFDSLQILYIPKNEHCFAIQGLAVYA